MGIARPSGSVRFYPIAENLHRRHALHTTQVTSPTLSAALVTEAERLGARIASAVENLRAWLFRVAHNKALDHLRRYDVRFGEPLDGEVPIRVEEAPLEAAEVAEWGLSYFTRITALQGSAVILKGVLSYSLEEISEILDTSVPSIKGALHRGRASLRRLATATDAPPPPALQEEQADLLGRYVTLFNARDFDGLRDMLAEDVRLDLVDKVERRGAADVGGYFDNYSRLAGIHLEVGVVDGRLAILARERPGEPQAIVSSSVSEKGGCRPSATIDTPGMSSQRPSRGQWGSPPDGQKPTAMQWPGAAPTHETDATPPARGAVAGAGRSTARARP